MTAKRFEINNDMSLDDKVETYELSCIVDTDTKSFYFVVDSIANVESFVERLNELHEENQSLLRKNGAMEEEIECLSEENEQLQARNDRQAKQLDNLYRLIEQKDWRTLTDIMDDFKRCEEQLQRESGTYGDVE